MFKKAGLWSNAVYVQRKHEFGIFIDVCVVGDV